MEFSSYNYKTQKILKVTYYAEDRYYSVVDDDTYCDRRGESDSLETLKKLYPDSSYYSNMVYEDVDMFVFPEKLQLNTALYRYDITEYVSYELSDRYRSKELSWIEYGVSTEDFVDTRIKLYSDKKYIINKYPITLNDIIICVEEYTPFAKFFITDKEFKFSAIDDKDNTLKHYKYVPGNLIKEDVENLIKKFFEKIKEDESDKNKFKNDYEVDDFCDFFEKHTGGKIFIDTFNRKYGFTLKDRNSYLHRFSSPSMDGPADYRKLYIYKDNSFYINVDRGCRSVRGAVFEI